MITQSFIDSKEYQEFKSILADTLQNKPINLKTEGKTNEMIAREVVAYEIAAKSVERAIRRFESKVVKPLKEEQKFI
jgi:hypothetical protein